MKNMKRFYACCNIYFLSILLTLCVLDQALAVTSYTDWGTISTTESSTIDFARDDITGNFADEYAFSILSGTDTSYAVTVSFDVCKNGCGNPEVSYGIYDANGSIISDTGSVVLDSGDYVFMIKGSGMGSGSQTDYTGSITFFVSTVPEPSDILLLLTGLAVVGGAVLYRKTGKRSGADCQL
jgi:hypothetical protein